VLEAYAHGKVVIASDMGALPEIVEDGVTGRLIEAEDLDRWQVAITEVLGDEQQTHRLGMAAREKAEKEFSPELHLQRLLDVFEKARATGLSR
jgi:glycosyltransferase involved in cell wall biosynthesis